MLLKITEKCSMNCTHCMNRATADGEHMTEQTFDDALDFLLDNNACDVITLTGGEPTEHPEFSKLMWKLISKMEYEERPCIVNITTNGFWCLEHPEEAKKIAVETKYVKVFWQVSTDRRYYPKELPTHKKLWREPGFCLCEDCVESLYPQGRAIDNYPDSCSAKASKCFNVRAIAKQITDPSVTENHKSISRIFAAVMSKNIGFDAKRAFNNQRGLGNYSRETIRILSTHYFDNQYLSHLVLLHLNYHLYYS